MRSRRTSEASAIIDPGRGKGGEESDDGPWEGQVLCTIRKPCV